MNPDNRELRYCVLIIMPDTLWDCYKQWRMNPPVLTTTELSLCLGDKTMSNNKVINAGIFLLENEFKNLIKSNDI